MYDWIEDPRIDPTKDFVISEQRLLECAVDTVRKLPIYGELYARSKAKVERCEEQLKNIESSVFLEHKKLSDKTNVETLKRVAITHPDYQHIASNLTSLNEQLYYAEGWWRAIQKTCDIIQMIGYSKNAEMKRI